MATGERQGIQAVAQVVKGYSCNMRKRATSKSELRNKKGSQSGCPPLNTCFSNLLQQAFVEECKTRFAVVACVVDKYEHITVLLCRNANLVLAQLNGQRVFASA